MATTSIGPSGVTFPNGTTQAAAATGTVTSITAGNGLTGGTITSSGTIALDVYSGTTANNASYPIGSYVVSNGAQVGDYTYRAVNSTQTVWSPPTSGALGQSYFSLMGSEGSGSSSLAGTWRTRGATATPVNCSTGLNFLLQRVA